MKNDRKKVLVIGAGLAGTEAAYYLASKGIEVVLIESKAVRKNEAQKLTSFTELVCTNSLKSFDLGTGHGILKEEMKALGSLVLKVAEQTRVPAGKSLSVDRDKFSEQTTAILKGHPLIEVLDQVVQNPVEEMKRHQCEHVIIATGPLTLSELEGWIIQELGADGLYFYDAIAPIVDLDGLDMDKLYWKDRGEETEGTADYLNAPFTKEEYEHFINELCLAEKVPSKDFEKENFFESCLPIDVMAQRGIDTARFGPMKPIGLEINGEMPYAVVQLRKENLLGSAFNLVGFQNRLKYGEQDRVFRLIPGLENAQFHSYGSVHRNTFLNAKKHLRSDFSMIKRPQVHFAGQIVGVEGYTESAMCGLYVANQIVRKLNGEDVLTWPETTAMGALVHYLMTSERPAPSNIHFGLFPDVSVPLKLRRPDRKKVKKEMVAFRARRDFINFQKMEYLAL